MNKFKKSILIVFGAFSGLQCAFAEIVVVDVEDSATVDFSHQGMDTATLQVINSLQNSFIVTGEDRLMVGTPNFFTFATQGESLPEMFTSNAFAYSMNGIFASGAASGLNYARLDLNGDLILETVVEFDLGESSDFEGDVITRYAYDDGGAALDIPEAITAMNDTVVMEQSVTEVSRIQRLSDGTVILSWESDLPEETDFVLRATDDPSLPLSMWSLISADLKSRGRGLTNTFNSADAKFMQPKLFFTIRKAVPGEDNL